MIMETKTYNSTKFKKQQKKFNRKNNERYNNETYNRNEQICMQYMTTKVPIFGVKKTLLRL